MLVHISEYSVEGKLHKIDPNYHIRLTLSQFPAMTKSRQQEEVLFLYLDELRNKRQRIIKNLSILYLPLRKFEGFLWMFFAK